MTCIVGLVSGFFSYEFLGNIMRVDYSCLEKDVFFFRFVRMFLEDFR